MLSEIAVIATLVTLYSYIVPSIARIVYKSLFKKDAIKFTAQDEHIFCLLSLIAFGGYYIINFFFNGIHTYTLYEIIQCASIAFALFLGLLFYYYIINKYCVPEIDNIDREINFINDACSNEYLKIDGVFAVSAIIITNDNRIVLCKRKGESKWIQPGTYIRTNKIYKNTEKVPVFTTPQQQLLDRIFLDTGINASNLEYVDVFQSGLEKDVKTLALFDESNTKPSDLKDNYLSPSPFLIQLEHSDQIKSSKTHNHMDMFYIFKLKVDFFALRQQIMIEARNNPKVSSEDIKAFDIKEIKEMVNNQTDDIYLDMHVISEYAMRCYRRYKHQVYSSLRHCTFNTHNRILWIRTSNYCNAKCKFCLMSNLRRNSLGNQTVNSDSLISVLKNYTSIQNIPNLKLIISGGEPFIISNLVDELVLKVLELPEYRDIITKISICTNGTLCYSNDIQDSILKLNSYCEKRRIAQKYVLDIPGYDSGSYKEQTNLTDKDWERLLNFAAFLNEKSISFCVNVIMSTTFKNKLERYLEFWKKNHFYDITLTYVIRNANNNNSKYLSKDECMEIFSKILSGDYETEFIRNIDFVIPECNDKYCQSKNIHSVYFDSEKNSFLVSDDCLDKMA